MIVTYYERDGGQMKPNNNDELRCNRMVAMDLTFDNTVVEEAVGPKKQFIVFNRSYGG
jgi:hypothetical protein